MDQDFSSAYDQWIGKQDDKEDDDKSDNSRVQEDKNAAKHTNNNCWMCFRITLNLLFWV